MKKEDDSEQAKFLLRDVANSLNSRLVSDGWITMCHLGSEKENDIDFQYYSYLVSNKQLRLEKQSTNWTMTAGSEGKPSVIGSFKKGKMVYRYYSLEDKGIEPIIFFRSFNIDNNRIQYFEISEEYVFYYNLYENGPTKQKRTYYKIDELGELEEVIKIDGDRVQFKQKYLLEYLKARRLNLIITFDFMKLVDTSLADLNVSPMNVDVPGKDFIYNHFIREIGKSQSWINGKKWIVYNKKQKVKYPFDSENRYEEFIVGHNEDGSEKMQSCKKSDDNHFVLTYFNKEVLDKYYNNPRKYKVDGWHVSCPYFTLKIDNHNHGYVPVFLRELSSLPHKEQLHWKQYNIPPKKTISPEYYKTMIEGNWIDHPGSIDHYFKSKYKSFNVAWQKKFGWEFYKPLATEDQHLFDALHLPSTNNVKSFCEQMLTVTKLTIDRLNEKDLSQGLILDPNDRGISKLEKFVNHHGYNIPDMIAFLRNLWNLRSGLFSHTFSNANKDCRKAMEYFKLNEGNYIDIAQNIFASSLNTINTLEGLFITNEGLDKVIYK